MALAPRRTRQRLIPGKRGLQSQRTYLSWSRLALLTLLNGGLLLVRSNPGPPEPTRMVASVSCLVLAAALLLVAAWRERALLSPARASAIPTGIVAAFCTGLATIALLVLASIART